MLMPPKRPRKSVREVTSSVLPRLPPSPSSSPPPLGSTALQGTECSIYFPFGCLPRARPSSLRSWGSERVSCPPPLSHPPRPGGGAWFAKGPPVGAMISLLATVLFCKERAVIAGVNLMRLAPRTLLPMGVRCFCLCPRGGCFCWGVRGARWCRALSSAARGELGARRGGHGGVRKPRAGHLFSPTEAVSTVQKWATCGPGCAGQQDRRAERRPRLLKGNEHRPGQPRPDARGHEGLKETFTIRLDQGRS